MQHLQPDTSYPVFNRTNGFENIYRHELANIFSKVRGSNKTKLIILYKYENSESQNFG